MEAAEAVVEDPVNQWKQQPTNSLKNRGRASRGQGTTISTAFEKTAKA